MEWYWIAAIVVIAATIWFTSSALLYKQFFKRFYDIVLSGLALIVLSPLLIVLTAVGAAAMRGNPFFVQPRPGMIDRKTGKERAFISDKLRTVGVNNKRVCLAA